MSHNLVHACIGSWLKLRFHMVYHLYEFRRNTLGCSVQAVSLCGKRWASCLIVQLRRYFFPSKLWNQSQAILTKINHHSLSTMEMNMARKAINCYLHAFVELLSNDYRLFSFRRTCIFRSPWYCTNYAFITFKAFERCKICTLATFLEICWMEVIDAF